MSPTGVPHSMRCRPCERGLAKHRVDRPGGRVWYVVNEYAKAGLFATGRSRTRRGRTEFEVGHKCNHRWWSTHHEARYKFEALT